MSIGDFLSHGNYSPSFANNFIAPQTSCIWSTSSKTCLQEFPIVSLIAFYRNHKMLQVFGRPEWLTIPFGAQTYVDRISQSLPDIRISSRVAHVWRASDRQAGSEFLRNQVTIQVENGAKEVFDWVIMATHGDTTRSLLRDLAPEEEAVLYAVRYSTNRAVLHRDSTLMPISKKVWAGLNYYTEFSNEFEEKESKEHKVCVTYWMNRLQPHIPESSHGDIFLTLNPINEPDPALVIEEFQYDHPVYSPNLVHAQAQLSSIAHLRYTGYAGAWTHYGFHEDGCTSGLAAAAALHCRSPFPVVFNGGYPTNRSGFPLVTGLPTNASIRQHVKFESMEVKESDGLAAKILKFTLSSFDDVSSSISQAAASIISPLRRRSFFHFIPKKWNMQQGSSRRILVRSAQSYQCDSLRVNALAFVERAAYIFVFSSVIMPCVIVLWMLGKVKFECRILKRKKHNEGNLGQETREFLWVRKDFRIMWNTRAS
jgi:hypothetical protein